MKITPDHMEQNIVVNCFQKGEFSELKKCHFYNLTKLIKY